MYIFGWTELHHHCDDTNSHQSWSINYIKIDAQSFDEWPPELPCREAGWYLFSHQPRLPTEQWASQAIVFFLILQPPLSLVCGTHRPCWFTTAIQITRWKNQGVEREFEADGGILQNYSGNWKTGEGGGKRALEEAGRYSTNPPCAHHMFTIYSPLTHQHHPYVRKVFH